MRVSVIRVAVLVVKKTIRNTRIILLVLMVLKCYERLGKQCI